MLVPLDKTHKIFPDCIQVLFFINRYLIFYYLSLFQPPNIQSMSIATRDSAREALRMATNTINAIVIPEVRPTRLKIPSK